MCALIRIPYSLIKIHIYSLVITIRVVSKATGKAFPVNAKKIDIMSETTY